MQGAFHLVFQNSEGTMVDTDTGVSRAIEFAEQTVHGLVCRGKTSAIRQHDRRFLNIRAAVDVVAAVMDQPFKILRDHFKVKL